MFNRKSSFPALEFKENIKLCLFFFFCLPGKKTQKAMKSNSFNNLFKIS